VERIGRDPEDEVLVSGIIHVATGLDLIVVAEGVGTPEQLRRIKVLGCELAQGNYFSESLRSEAASKFLSKNDSRK
jgi:EAL domain-containing protein (putative c-di-GMP-specific phosphodiesterase class I)